jgi:2'-5' RNA ligase
VAADLPAEVRAALWTYGREVASVADAGLRAIDEDSLHVTLCFLGARPEEEVALLDAALEAALRGVGPAPQVWTGSTAWLPVPRRPRVLAVDLQDPSGGLREVQDVVAGAVTDAVGWEPEHRAFRPHVSVARVRRGGRPPRDLPEPPQLELTVPAVTLYRSELGGGPARYRALARVALV